MALNYSQKVDGHVRAAAGTVSESATNRKFWFGLSRSVIDEIAENWHKTRHTYTAARQQHYFSAEFLMGRALLNNLTNLGRVEEASAAAADLGHNLVDVLEAENDAALGNGGLGRLAACFLDSAVTQNLPVTGYGLLYRYGLFRQEFQNGFQVEHPDPWREDGNPFTIRRHRQRLRVNFDDMIVQAIPYDMPITGYGTDNVGTLRLWKAEPLEEFDYDAFNSQRFTDAIIERERVNDICRVLYPNDTSYEGKKLRVRQQYFFTSASLQQMVNNYVTHHGEDLSDFARYNSIQLNDTHPVLAIPELMRLLMDEHGMGWEKAWEIVTETFAYTNHTVLTEALETWEISIFQSMFWRIWEIIAEIDRRFRLDMAGRGLEQQVINRMAPVANGSVRMAWIACYASFSINGVAAIHSEIIKRDTLKDWSAIWPEKFNNKTNGVTPRRWLRMINPGLSGLLTRLVGSDEWVTDLDRLKELRSYENDEKVLRELIDIKRENKVKFAEWIRERQGVEVDPDSIFDTQIKRLHEYKRQLLNALYILDLYFRIKDGELDVPKRTFVFGAKAAPGYVRAKAVIKLINTIGDLVNNDPDTRDIIRVVFIENYNVSPAEKIIPATDVSEQISLAGKEASGTGNMKFMMNGALTLGTMDGANVEIVDAVGEDNAYIFGVRVEGLDEAFAEYSPHVVYESVPGLKRVLDAFDDGTLDDQGTGMFHDLKNSILHGYGVGANDVYYVLGDFADYRETRDRMARDYFEDPMNWARMCWVNICESGRFSSDRTINDYATETWKIEPAPITVEAAPLKEKVVAAVKKAVPAKKATAKKTTAKKTTAKKTTAKKATAKKTTAKKSTGSKK